MTPGTATELRALPPTSDETPVRYRLLGQVRAERGTQPLAPGTPKQQALLAALLLRGDEQVERAELIRAVWGEHAPASAPGLLATYTARLRKALEPDRARRAAPRLLITRGTTYGLRLGRDALDLWRFEDAVAQARSERRAGRAAEARSGYEQALAQWRGGQALSGVPGRHAADARRRLAALRVDALLEHAEVLLDLGEQAEAADLVAPLVPARPHDERLQGLLMLALYRTGRTPEALAVFRRVRRALVHDLGVEPGPHLTRLHDRILRADPSLAAPRQAARAAAPVCPTPALPAPAQLPRDSADFTGREAEVRELHEVLRRPESPATPCPTVVVHGAAGLGKSALAVHVAHQVRDRFPDGQLYAVLGGRNPAEVLGRFLEDLGVPPHEVPDGLERRAVRFRTLTAERRLLVLLDDARDLDQLRELLPAAPGCAVLVTSRAPLRELPGRFALRLGPLDAAQSLRMLRRFASGAPRTAVAALPLPYRADTVSTLHSLADGCAGQPLALRLAAARAADEAARAGEAFASPAVIARTGNPDGLRAARPPIASAG
ncbi:BTAD domain-containing putative transcriptional regulator [Streptomyces sp. VRA16 Mangrove soil]|uniref:AfsR/SARP family transcriptional regulator n=1 Tax=Streptomyces sp. VRA16 Mangrove soil TaxID=2817434 RepID=UPI001A9ECACF|nr:BTAD domain-containing putative transcriptional regulator [Streptomyces sp. VRA16 Mangrove soil]MBO1329777.1 AAA family ATPase [Streptomyces sp. VRA16 Mangrove soil]